MNGKSGRILKTRIEKDYERVGLSLNGVDKDFSVHRLVAMVFIPNPENKPTVNHINIHNLSAAENKQDNCIENLEWATYPEQAEHALRTKLREPLRGEDNPAAKLTEEDVKNISMIFTMNELTISEIATLFKVDYETIRDIYCGNTWRHITCDYDFSNYTKLGCEIYTDEQIHHVCRFLEENKLLVSEISKETGVDEFNIRHIIRKDSWLRISNNYNISNYDKIRPVTKNTEEQIHHVCKLLEENKLTLHEISDITSVKYKVVNAILNGKNWKHISSLYNINYTAFEIKK